MNRNKIKSELLKLKNVKEMNLEGLVNTVNHLLKTNYNAKNLLGMNEFNFNSKDEKMTIYIEWEYNNSSLDSIKIIDIDFLEEGIISDEENHLFNILKL